MTPTPGREAPPVLPLPLAPPDCVVVPFPDPNGGATFLVAVLTPASVLVACAVSRSVVARMSDVIVTEGAPGFNTIKVVVGLVPVPMSVLTLVGSTLHVL